MLVRLTWLRNPFTWTITDQKLPFLLLHIALINLSSQFITSSNSFVASISQNGWLSAVVILFIIRGKQKWRFLKARTFRYQWWRSLFLFYTIWRPNMSFSYFFLYFKRRRRRRIEQLSSGSQSLFYHASH